MIKWGESTHFPGRTGNWGETTWYHLKEITVRIELFVIYAYILPQDLVDYPGIFRNQDRYLFLLLLTSSPISVFVLFNPEQDPVILHSMSTKQNINT